MKQTAYVEGYGCSLNKADSQRIQGMLSLSGYTLVEKPEKAGLVIINTCAVKRVTENRMLNRIGKLKKMVKPKTRLVVAGCLPKINKEKLTNRFPGISTVGNTANELNSILSLKGGYWANLEKKRLVSIIPITRGCMSNCSFCAVPLARGHLGSHSLKELKKKFFQATRFSKIVCLTSPDTGVWGFEFRKNLPFLVNNLLTVKGSYRVRIGMMNPQHLKRFKKEMKEVFLHEKVFSFLHLPVQSGSESVLRRMRRGYFLKDFLELVKYFRENVPGITLATDIIVGFPGETEKEFNDTIKVLKKTMPDITNISRYGKRPGTIAAKMENQLHGRTKKERSRKLTRICQKISLKQNQKLVGTIQEVVIAEKGKNNTVIGRTKSYKQVVLKKAVLGTKKRVEITHAFPGYLKGKIVS